LRVARARVGLNAVNFVERLAQNGLHPPMHCDRFRTLYVIRQVAVTPQQLIQLFSIHARQQRRVRDFVAVQMQDRQHRAVTARVEELVGVPRRRERAGLRFAVAYHTRSNQTRIVERGAVCVRQRVAELTALMDRSRRFRRDVTRNAARKRELFEQLLHSRRIARDRRIDLAVRPLQVRVGDDAGSTVSRTGDQQHRQIALLDRTVQMRIDEVETGRCAPMAEQPRLDVFDRKRLRQQRIVEQVDLTDAEVVCRAPIGIDRRDFLVGHRVMHRRVHVAIAPHAAR
jgi:hypothetical protein